MQPEPPRIDSQAGWVQALHWGFALAIEQQARCITCVDASFAGWPLDAPGLLEPLAAWLRLPQRRLVLLAAHYDELPRQHPRFTGWRRSYAHAIEAWQAPVELASGLPCLLLADADISVQLIDAEHWRGRAQQDGRVAHLLREQTDVVLQRSERAFPMNTLGL